MTDEVVLERVNATLDGINNSGVLELTSRRLTWRAHRIRLPITAIFGDKKLSLPLDEIESCRAKSFALFVETANASHMFRLYRWWNPALLWWKLTRRWAVLINAAKLKVENEDSLLMEKDVPT
jgi:hypothetical protein